MQGEKIDEYNRRFRKLLRKVNVNDLVPAALQVRMYLYGLNPLLTPLVASQNPNTLDAAMDRARVVETSYNYNPYQSLTLPVPEGVSVNPVTPPAPAPKTTDMDDLTKQMQQLSLNYANLSSVLMARNQNQATRPTGQ
jgi:hypothetical protein